LHPRRFSFWPAWSWSFRFSPVLVFSSSRIRCGRFFQRAGRICLWMRKRSGEIRVHENFKIKIIYNVIRAWREPRQRVRGSAPACIVMGFASRSAPFGPNLRHWRASRITKPSGRIYPTELTTHPNSKNHWAFSPPPISGPPSRLRLGIPLSFLTLSLPHRTNNPVSRKSRGSAYSKMLEGRE
jgi:hypothetical protein